MSETSDLVAETVSNLVQVEEFLPRRFLRNGHLQTLIGNFKPRQCVLPEAEARLVEVDPGKGAAAESTPSIPVASERLRQARTDVAARGASYVLCHCHWQANAPPCPTLLLVHGLEGSSRSQYMLGNAARAWAAG